MQIKRDFYLQQLVDGKQNGLIKIVTGIRRCGKSFLLFKLFRQYLLDVGVDSDHILHTNTATCDSLPLLARASPII